MVGYKRQGALIRLRGPDHNFEEELQYLSDMEKVVMLPRSDLGFHQIFRNILSQDKVKSNSLCISEVSYTLLRL